MLNKTLKNTAVMVILSMGLSSTNVLAKEISKNEVISGKDRVETAIKIAEKSWSGKWKDSHVAVLASKENKNLIDALTVSPLAYKLKAPILLSGFEKIDDDTLKALKKQKITKVYIVNGDGVISENVESKLKSMNIKVQRLGGQDRYKTCENILKELKKNNVSLDKLTLVSSNGVADALSISSVASFLEMPIIFTKGQDKIASEFQDDIKKANKIYAVGGSKVISDKLLKEVNAERLGGLDRYETNKMIIDEFSKNDLKFDKVYLANGQNNHLVDSLVGSVLAAQTNSPIVLGQNKDNSGFEGIDGKTTEKTSFIQLGGAVDKSFAEKAEGKDTINDLEITDVITDTKGYINAQDVHSEYKVVISGISDPYSKIKLTVLDDKEDVTDKVTNENTTTADSDGNWILTMGNLEDIKDGKIKIIIRDNKNRETSKEIIKDTKLPDLNFNICSLTSDNVLNYPINISVGKDDSLESVYVTGDDTKHEIEMKKDSEGKYSGNINLITMKNEGDIVLVAKAKTESGSTLEKSLNIPNHILYENIVSTAKSSNQEDMEDELNNYVESKKCDDNYYKELTDKQKELASAILMTKIKSLGENYNEDNLYSDLNNASVEASCFKNIYCINSTAYNDFMNDLKDLLVNILTGVMKNYDSGLTPIKPGVIGANIPDVQIQPDLIINATPNSLFVQKDGKFVPLSTQDLNSQNLEVNGQKVKKVIYSNKKHVFLIFLDKEQALNSENTIRYKSSNNIYCQNKSKTSKEFNKIKLESFTYKFKNDSEF